MATIMSGKINLSLQKSVVILVIDIHKHPVSDWEVPFTMTTTN